MAPSWPFSCSESHQQPLALDGSAPFTHHGAAYVLLRVVSPWSRKAHVSLRPWLTAQQEWARPPGPHQVKGSVSLGGTPAGHCGRARAAALHQLGGLRHLLCEPGAGPGRLPDEPERLPELLGCADGYVMPSCVPTAPQ